MNLTDITKQIRAFADQLEEQSKPDPYAGLKAAHAAGKVIQSFNRERGGIWQDCPSPAFEGGTDYRIKPEAPSFQLPPPPPGMQWHRTDGWKAEDLPPGTRPHVYGEGDSPGDEVLANGHWNKTRVAVATGSFESNNHRRTTRPLVFTHEGKSWTWRRPGDPMPCGEQERVTVLYNDPVQEFRGAPCPANCFAWRNPSGNTPIIGWRYAEPITREVELGPCDVPPGSVVKHQGQKIWSAIVAVETDGFYTRSQFCHWTDARHNLLINRPKHRDENGNPTLWGKCSKEVPA